MGAGLKYEELFPPPPQRAEAVKPAEAAKPAKAEAAVETAKHEAQRPAKAPAEAAKPAKPEQAEALKPEARRPAVEERGLRPEAARPEAVEPAVRGLRREAGRLEAAEARGLGRAELGERPGAPVADVIPERAFEAVEYLVERFDAVLDKEAAFKAEGFVIAKVKARIERVARREPELAHILGEAAEDVLRSLGRLMASPDAARHVRTPFSTSSRGMRRGTGRGSTRASSPPLGRP